MGIIQPPYFMYLFIHGLFNDSINSSDYIFTCMSDYRRSLDW
jgi:hypothetical protein